MSQLRMNDSADHDMDELTLLEHDIRGCVHAMRMGRELLEQWFQDEKLREVCAAMESEERKASQLLDKLSAVARGQKIKRR